MTTNEFHDIAHTQGARSLHHNLVRRADGKRLSLGTSGKAITLYSDGKRRRAKATEANLKAFLSNEY